jgi:hypothetical protein
MLPFTTETINDVAIFSVGCDWDTENVQHFLGLKAAIRTVMAEGQRVLIEFPTHTKDGATPRQLMNVAADVMTPLLRRLHDMAKVRTHLKVCNLDENLRQMFDVSKLSLMIDCHHPNRESALSAFSSDSIPDPPA